MTISISKILVPTDFSETAEKAVTYGVELAKRFNAKLDLLHAFDEVILYAPTTADVYREKFEAGIQEDLDKVTSKMEGVEVESVMRRGAPFVEIIRYAKENDVDLIVIGSHGRGAVMHMLLGSVAEKVVRKAPCPVLTVRDREREFVMP